MFSIVISIVIYQRDFYIIASYLGIISFYLFDFQTVI
jgi:hypothetical protein